MIGHALFDLDGTLLDSAGLCAGIVNAMLEARGAGARVSAADARRHMSAGAHHLVAALLGPALGDPARDLIAFRTRYAALPTPPSSLFPGVREGLAQLQDAGVRLAICSNKPQALCEKVVEDLGLADCFEAVVGSSPQWPSKPDPAHLERTLALARGLRERSCYVGDSRFDLLAAQRTGLPFILAAYGYAEADLDAEGAQVAGDFAAVPALVLDALAPAGRRRERTVLRKTA